MSTADPDWPAEERARVACGECEALRAEVERLTRERNALLVGYLAVATKSDIRDMEHVLDIPWKRAALVESVIKRVGESDQKKYLSMPADLGGDS